MDCDTTTFWKYEMTTFRSKQNHVDFFSLNPLNGIVQFITSGSVQDFSFINFVSKYNNGK